MAQRAGSHAARSTHGPARGRRLQAASQEQPHVHANAQRATRCSAAMLKPPAPPFSKGGRRLRRRLDGGGRRRGGITPIIQDSQTSTSSSTFPLQSPDNMPQKTINRPLLLPFVVDTFIVIDIMSVDAWGGFFGVEEKGLLPLHPIYQKEYILAAACCLLRATTTSVAWSDDRSNGFACLF